MYEEIKDKFKGLEEKLITPALLKDPSSMVKVSKEHASLKKTIDLIIELEKINDNIKQNNEIIKTESEGELQTLASEELILLNEKAKQLQEALEEEINPANPNDKKNAIVEIRAGAGGDEAALFAGDLFRMYARFCERQGWKLSLINSSVIGIGGYKEIIFSVNGESAYG
ncbi:MAG: PCRF domain-containing protein, partial [Patescibacteria group bacterium]